MKKTLLTGALIFAALFALSAQSVDSAGYYYNRLKKQLSQGFSLKNCKTCSVEPQVRTNRVLEQVY